MSAAFPCLSRENSAPLARAAPNSARNVRECDEQIATREDGGVNTRPAATIAVLGGGPAGLIAAETLARAGACVTVYDRMPAVGRKFMLAGRGGLNLTHSEPFEQFIERYGPAADWLAPALRAFPPDALRAWALELGQETFVGSSGRVFPSAFRATPLLRAWLARLGELGVTSRVRHDWLGWTSAGKLRFATPEGEFTTSPDATILAFGGASWPRVGSTGTWTEVIRSVGIEVTPLTPANSGFFVEWSELFRNRFAGVPMKNVRLSCNGQTVRGEAMITKDGIEGGAIYALGTAIRQAIARDGVADLRLDLHPDLSREVLASRLAKRRKGDSLTTALKRVGLPPVAIALAHEVGAAAEAAHLKSLPLELLRPTSIDRAISTAGGIPRSEVDDHFGLGKKPGVFVAGEMLDWEAPTGGYLLQACFSTGVAAALGALEWLEGESSSSTQPSA
jgi:uncharacterized flavoprotein (TIGR03862 family)